jgi:hypothetical protein
MFEKTRTRIVKVIGKINWGGNRYKMTAAELETIRKMLKKDYYIILTRHDGHLSTFSVNLAHWVLTGRWGFYIHALMNLEGDVTTDTDFRLIEANGLGVHYSHFMDIFSCDSVALLKPKSMDIELWTHVLDKVKTNLGKPYDTLFDLKQDQSFSCVSLIRNALMAYPGYDIHFANFEALVQKSKNVSPNMLYECPDFEVVWESRHS